MLSDELKHAFWSRVRIGSDGECWIWEGSLNDGGYGWLSFKGKRIAAHRLSLWIATGDDGAGRFALHACDVECCVSPLHLRWGSPMDNTRDAMWNTRVGGSNVCPWPLTRLTAVQVRRARALVRLGMSPEWIARAWRFPLAPLQGVYGEIFGRYSDSTDPASAEATREFRAAEAQWRDDLRVSRERWRAHSRRIFAARKKQVRKVAMDANALTVEVRCRVAAGEAQAKLAAEFGVSPSLICHVVKGRRRMPARIPARRAA